MSDKTVTGPAPWWRYYEPPRWFPKWLHRLTCTHCRELSRYGARLSREAKRERQRKAAADA